MEPLICEGAMLIVDISAELRNGNYCVFELDGDLCMKRYWQENGVITLHSENKSYAPIVVQEHHHFRVIGKITKFILKTSAYSQVDLRLETHTIN